MKKSLPKEGKGLFKRSVIGAAFFGLCFLVLPKNVAWSQSGQGASSTDPNQFFSFKKIYAYPVEDNVDGAFKPLIEKSYREVFEKNPRFDLTSSAAEADSAIRTKLSKQGEQFNFNFQFSVLSNNPAEPESVFAVEKASLRSDATADEISQAAKKGLKALLKKIPFYGTVTGKEQTMTFDIGGASGLKAGDIVQISRIDAIKKHPLLKSILDVTMLPVGTARVDSVEGTIAFATTQEEMPGETIQRMHKITSVVGRADAKSEDAPKEINEFSDKDEWKDGMKPQIGYIGLGPFLGSLSAAMSRNDGSTSVAGSAFNPGVKLSSEIWLTKNWFADLGFGISTASLTLKDDRTGSKSSSFSTTATNFEFDVGYRHFLWNTLRGPNFFAKLGYGSFSWKTPTIEDSLMGSKSYGGMRAGIGGSVPFYSKNLGLFAGLNLGLFNSYTEETTKISTDTSQDSSVSMVNFQLGFYNYVYDNMAFRVSFLLDIYSAEFTGGATKPGTSETSQKQIGFMPALLYYF